MGLDWREGMAVRVNEGTMHVDTLPYTADYKQSRCDDIRDEMKSLLMKVCRKKDLEIPYSPDPIDEYAVPQSNEFDGRALQSTMIDRAPEGRGQPHGRTLRHRMTVS